MKKILLFLMLSLANNGFAMVEGPLAYGGGNVLRTDGFLDLGDLRGEDPDWPFFEGTHLLPFAQKKPVQKPQQQEPQRIAQPVKPVPVAPQAIPQAPMVLQPAQLTVPQEHQTREHVVSRDVPSQHQPEVAVKNPVSVPSDPVLPKKPAHTQARQEVSVQQAKDDGVDGKAPKSPRRKKSSSPRVKKQSSRSSREHDDSGALVENPWKKFIDEELKYRIKGTESLGQKELDGRLKKTVLMILEKLRTAGKSAGYMLIKDLVAAGAAPKEVWELVEDDTIVDPCINAIKNKKHPSGHRKKSFKRAVYFQINLGRLLRGAKKKEKIFGSCGNDDCLLAEYVLVLTAPSNSKVASVTRNEAAKEIPHFVDRCGDVEKHTMNNKPIVEVLLETMPKAPSYADLRNELARRGIHEQEADIDDDSLFEAEIDLVCDEAFDDYDDSAITSEEMVS